MNVGVSAARKPVVIVRDKSPFHQAAAASRWLLPISFKKCCFLLFFVFVRWFLVV
jgi:hypothetical protein